MNWFEVTRPKRELDVPLCVLSGQVFRWELDRPDRVHGVDGDHAYWIEWEEDEDSVWYGILTNGNPNDFEHLFRLDMDWSASVHAMQAAGPELTEPMESLPGLRVMRPTCPVETFFCFLCTANNNLARILPMCRALASYGEPMIEGEGRLVRRFPEPEVVAAIDSQELREKGFGYRAETITNAAKQLEEKGGREWLMGLREKPYEESWRELMSLKGLGPKLADCICLYGLDQLDAVPVDTHLWQASVRVYFPEWKDKSLTATRYRAIGDHFRGRFGGLAGWAHQYLFYDNLLRGKVKPSERG